MHPSKKTLRRLAKAAAFQLVRGTAWGVGVLLGTGAVHLAVQVAPYVLGWIAGS